MLTLHRLARASTKLLLECGEVMHEQGLLACLAVRCSYGRAHIGHGQRLGSRRRSR